MIERLYLLPHWAILLLALVFSLVVAWVLKLIFNFLSKRRKHEDRYSVFYSLLKNISRPLNFLLPVLVFNIVVSIISLQEPYQPYLVKVLNILLVVAVANLLVGSIGVIEDFIFHSYNLNKKDNLKERKIRTQLQFVRKLAITVIVVVAVSAVLLSFENVRRIGAGLLTGVGIGGIIIGFAAQKSLANFLAGFQIAFTQPIRIDDVLVVEGEWGKVEEITLTYVVLSIWDQRRLILPINYFIEKPFQNWTRSTAEILGTVFLYVDHTFPVESLRPELDRLLAASPLWDKRVGILQVTDAKEKTIELRVLVSAADSSDAFDLRCEVREGLLKFIAEHNMELPKTRLDVLQPVYNANAATS